MRSGRAGSGERRAGAIIASRLAARAPLEMNLKTRADDRSGLRAVAHGFSRGKRGLFNSSKPASAGDRVGPRARSALSPAKAGSKGLGGPGFPRLKPWATALAPSATGMSYHQRVVRSAQYEFIRRACEVREQAGDSANAGYCAPPARPGASQLLGMTSPARRSPLAACRRHS
jgi:hypothetical protein